MVKNYISKHTGLEIDNAIDEIANKASSSEVNELIQNVNNISEKIGDI